MTVTPRQVLACPMGDNDAGAGTVGDYLIRLLTELWNEGEGFSGKRPFGNSGWESDIYTALVAAGLVPGTVDPDGYLDDFSWEDEQKANRLVADAISSLLIARGADA